MQATSSSAPARASDLSQGSAEDVLAAAGAAQQASQDLLLNQLADKQSLFAVLSKTPNLEDTMETRYAFFIFVMILMTTFGAFVTKSCL